MTSASRSATSSLRVSARRNKVRLHAGSARKRSFPNQHTFQHHNLQGVHRSKLGQVAWIASMNTKAPYDRPSIRSVDFAQFEKPKAKAHWSFDETLAPRKQRRQPNLVAQALRMLSAMTAE